MQTNGLLNHYIGLVRQRAEFLLSGQNLIGTETRKELEDLRVFDVHPNVWEPTAMKTIMTAFDMLSAVAGFVNLLSQITYTEVQYEKPTPFPKRRAILVLMIAKTSETRRKAREQISAWVAMCGTDHVRHSLLYRQHDLIQMGLEVIRDECFYGVYTFLNEEAQPLFTFGDTWDEAFTYYQKLRTIEKVVEGLGYLFD